MTTSVKEEVKHTPGPWRIVALENTLLIASNTPFGDIAKVFRDKKYVEDKEGETLANAKLIASAPELKKQNHELLELLKEALNTSDMVPSVREKIENRISKSNINEQ